MSNKNLIAGFIAFAMVIWLFSGELSSNVVIADDNVEPSSQDELPFVRAIISEATVRDIYLAVSGQTEANRVVQVKAEVSGRVELVAAEKGANVKEGDLLCRIAVDTRQSELDQAEANLVSTQLEYKGILDLKQRGLQSEINVAKAKAALEVSRAALNRAELTLAKTNIVAPFDGVVETQTVELGDFLNVGQNCVTLIEIDPVLIVGQVAEKSIGALNLGDEVSISLITGDALTGTLSFIGRSPDASTRTYPIEVTVETPGENIRAGLSAQMNLPLGAQPAHLISSAALVLNDQGMMGVRVVDDHNIVHFAAIKILSEETQGVWVSGLGERVSLITVGHEEVFEGDLVRVDLTPLGSMVSL